MSDNRKYYYLKLKENFYNSETMVILESMQDGLLYSNLLLKMYLMSLKSGGILVLVYPCENHLIELRRALYDDVRKVETDLPSSTLSLLSKKEVTYSFNLESSKQISDLLTMTPYVYRAPKDKVECVKQKNDLSLTADFCLCTLEKTSR